MGTDVIHLIFFFFNGAIGKLTTMFTYTIESRPNTKFNFIISSHISTRQKFNKTCRRLIECHLVCQIGVFSFHIMCTLIRTISTNYRSIVLRVFLFVCVCVSVFTKMIYLHAECQITAICLQSAYMHIIRRSLSGLKVCRVRARE